MVVFQALAAVPIALLERELEFHQKFYIDTLPTLVYAALAVVLAWQGGMGVWSLVWGRLAAALATCVAAWRLSPWRPTGRWNWTHLREVVAYGRFVTGAAAVSFLVVNIDDALLTGLVGTKALGLYAMAYLFANLPATAISHIVNRVAFPAYARLEDVAQRALLYRRLVRGVAMLALPLACLLGLLAEAFVRGVLGEEWLAAIASLHWLAGYGLLRSILSNTGPLFNAAGMPQAVLKVNLLQLSILAVVLYPLIHWYGVVGASAGIVVGTLLSAPLALKYVHSVSGLSVWEQFGMLRPLLWPTLAMCAIAVVAQRGFVVFYPHAGALVQLLSAGGIGALVYSGVLYCWRRPVLVDTVALFRGQEHE
jgi:O-antigen/teichoic acid export membrane protein